LCSNISEKSREYFLWQVFHFLLWQIVFRIKLGFFSPLYGGEDVGHSKLKREEKYFVLKSMSRRERGAVEKK